MPPRDVPLAAEREEEDDSVCWENNETDVPMDEDAFDDLDEFDEEAYFDITPAEDTSAAEDVRAAFPSTCAQSPHIVLVTHGAFVQSVHHLIDSIVAASPDTSHADAFRHMSSDNWNLVNDVSVPGTGYDTAHDGDLVHMMCSVCEEISPTLPFGPQCQHVVCVECWRSYIGVYMSDDVHHPNPYLITCPCTSCNARLDDAMFKRLVINNPHTFAQYERMLTRSIFSTFKGDRVKPCVNNDCSKIAFWVGDELIAPGAPSTVMCDCGCRWCFACHDESIGAHFPLSCYQVQTLVAFGDHMRGRGAKLLSIQAAMATLEHAFQLKQSFASSLLTALTDPANVETIDFVSVNAKRCPGCRQGFLFKPHNHPAKEDEVVYCGGDGAVGCGLSFCWFCEETAIHLHDRKPTDKLHICAWQDTEFGSLTKEVVEKIDAYRLCPKCRIVIEKTEGCSHMRCACGCHFCWECGNVTASRFDPHICSKADVVGSAYQEEIIAVLSSKTRPIESKFADAVLHRAKAISRHAQRHFLKHERWFPQFQFNVIFSVNLLYWCHLHLRLMPLINPDKYNTMATFDVEYAVYVLRRVITRFVEDKRFDLWSSWTDTDLQHHVHELARELNSCLVRVMYML